MVTGVGVYSMADVPEDDITIIDGVYDDSSEHGARPVFSFQLPTPSTSAPQLSSDINPASHHALSFAYTDLKKRYNELEGKNKALLKNLHKAKKNIRESQEGDIMNGEIRFHENVAPRPQFGGALVARDNQTDSCEDGETNLMSDVEAHSHYRDELAMEKKAKLELSRKLQEMTLQHRESQASGAAELQRMCKRLNVLETENKDLKDDNVNTKRKLKDSQDAAKKLSQTKLQVEKQLKQNEEYQDLILSQMDRMRSSVEGSFTQQSNTTIADLPQDCG